MAIEKKELEIAKEADDVLALVEAIVETIKNKKPYAELIDELVTAISGMEEIPEEAKNIPALSTVVGFRVGKIINLFLAKAAEEE